MNLKNKNNIFFFSIHKIISKFFFVCDFEKKNLRNF
jgi:hypothetical protein